jgi:hypothetical protein
VASAEGWTSLFDQVVTMVAIKFRPGQTVVNRFPFLPVFAGAFIANFIALPFNSLPTTPDPGYQHKRVSPRIEESRVVTVEPAPRGRRQPARG